MKLRIDLEKIRGVDPGRIECSYFAHPDNRGVVDLIEQATFYLICRRCELGTCVESCPREALEKQENDVVKRYPLRCSNCFSCAAACPFGIIIPEYIPFHTSVCDYCLERLPPGEAPLCARTAPAGMIEYGEFAGAEEEGIFPVNENLLVKASSWRKEDV